MVIYWLIWEVLGALASVLMCLLVSPTPRVFFTGWGGVTLLCGAFVFGQSTTIAVMQVLGRIWESFSEDRPPWTSDMAPELSRGPSKTCYSWPYNGLNQKRPVEVRCFPLGLLFFVASRQRPRLPLAMQRWSNWKTQMLLQVIVIFCIFYWISAFNVPIYICLWMRWRAL